ncbi:hypothetical protein COO92_01015 [Thalassospira lohafexi]|uniref:Uncharacterized protein n=1 Tax=Thalassospira lohafexi TaxID=744227 RepID=A0A2N3LB66_9PROT|nr:hypothetical protein COO92_01015 [Thalassospira lohafexi]
MVTRVAEPINTFAVFILRGEIGKFYGQGGVRFQSDVGFTGFFDASQERSSKRLALWCPCEF